MSPWSIPAGWTFVPGDESSCPAIERDVGAFTLTVGDDGGKWVWWVCSQGSNLGTANGAATDMIDGVALSLDAVAKALA